MDKLLQTTLVDVVRFLDERGVPYAMIGGLAVALRGEPRVTTDVDLVIHIDIDGAVGLSHKLAESQFRPLFAGVEEVVQRSFILPLRHASTGIKVDLAIGLSGFEQRLVARAERFEVGNCQIAVATAEDLLVMKLLAGRPRDQQDAEGIAKVQAERLDWAYCLETAAQLGDELGEDLSSSVENLRVNYGPAK